MIGGVNYTTLWSTTLPVCKWCGWTLGNCACGSTKPSHWYEGQSWAWPEQPPKETAEAKRARLLLEWTRAALVAWRDYLLVERPKAPHMKRTDRCRARTCSLDGAWRARAPPCALVT